MTIRHHLYDKQKPIISLGTIECPWLFDTAKLNANDQILADWVTQNAQ